MKRRRSSLTVKWMVTLLLTSLAGVLLVGLFASHTTVFEYDRLRIDEARATFLSLAASYYQSNQTWDGIEDWLREQLSDKPFKFTTTSLTKTSEATSQRIGPAPAPHGWVTGASSTAFSTRLLSGTQPTNDESSTQPTVTNVSTPNIFIQSQGVLAGNTGMYGASLLDTSAPQATFTMFKDPPRLFALANRDNVVVAGFGPFRVGDTVNASLVKEGTPILVDGQQVGTALLAQLPGEFNPLEKRYLESINRALIGGALGSGAVALALGVLLSRHFLRPLAELTQAIKAMERGQLSQQVQVRTQDELGVLAQAFNRMSQELHRANQLRKQMTADIAHDLRTPLMIISGYLEAMRDGTLAPTQERFEAMNQETLLLKRLIEDLRTLSLADAGELKFMTQPIHPREILEQVKESFRPLADEASIILAVEADDSLAPVDVDRARIGQVLSNLISNALRYTSAGGTITLAARPAGDRVQLLVNDTGEGIPADKLPNIFERFYRVDDSRNQDQGESGLGLAIAKAIVEAHKGTITANSVLGSGTEMIITLPAVA